MGRSLLPARRPRWWLPAVLGSAPAPRAAREAGKAVLPSSMPGAPPSTGTRVPFLSKKGAWGLLGGPLSPTVLAVCRPCSSMAAHFSTPPPHGLWAPAPSPCPSGPNAAACLVSPFLGPSPSRCGTRNKCATDFSTRIFTQGSFPVGFRVWLLRRARWARSRVSVRTLMQLCGLQLITGGGILWKNYLSDFLYPFFKVSKTPACYVCV